MPVHHVNSGLVDQGMGEPALLARDIEPPVVAPVNGGDHQIPRFFALENPFGHRAQALHRQILQPRDARALIRGGPVRRNAAVGCADAKHQQAPPARLQQYGRRFGRSPVVPGTGAAHTIARQGI
ncbi:hypothetical protein D3C80_1809360 [compost metagenome]